MSDQLPTNQPHGANNNASNTSNASNASNAPNATNTQQPPAIDFALSEHRALARADPCRRFKNITAYYSEASRRHNVEDNPSEEARENAKGLKVQWNQHILANEGATGLNEALKDSFIREAMEEVRRLERFKQPETAVEFQKAWAAWKEVEKLVDECEMWKEDVDHEMARFK